MGGQKNILPDGRYPFDLKFSTPTKSDKKAL